MFSSGTHNSETSDSTEPDLGYSVNNAEEDYFSDRPDVPLIEADGKFPKARHILGLLGFLGFANVYAMRVNLSVAIVAMVNHTAIPQEDDNITYSCPGPSNTTAPAKDGDFVWDETTQGIILGAFFYGYVLTQIPGGRLAELMGGKRIYGYGVLITAVFTLLTPIAANWNLPALIIVRIFEGVGEGVTFPAMHAMLAKWVPPLERSKFAAITYAGVNFGTVISLPLSGWLCTLDFMGGWPLAFYIFGVLGLVWFIAWMLLVYDSPESHPWISREEKLYIQKATRCIDDELVDPTEEEPVPWLAMAKSLPLWAILITQCGQAWAFYTQLTELPTYMDNILHFSIQANGFLSALPYLTSWIFSIVFSVIADWILAKGWISQVNSFKLWNSVASVGVGLSMVGVAWSGCDKMLVLVMLAASGAFGGAVYAGNQMNHIPLSPRFAGTMYGITNAAGNTCGFLAPYVIGLMINGSQTVDTWKLVFYLAALTSVFGNFFYICFAKAEEEPWSKARPQRQP